MSINLSAPNVRASAGALGLNPPPTGTGSTVSLSSGGAQMLFEDEYSSKKVVALYGDEMPRVNGHLFVSAEGTYTAQGNKVAHFHQGVKGSWDGDEDQIYYGVIDMARDGGQRKRYVVSYLDRGVTCAENMWSEYEHYPGDIVGLSLGVGVNGLKLDAWKGSEPDYTGTPETGPLTPKTLAVFEVNSYTRVGSRHIEIVLS